MKRFSILLAAAALFGAITGCQKEPAGEDAPENTNSYVSFTINFNSDVTKADYADPGETAPGTPAEHEVKNAYLYFFKGSKYVSTITIAAEDITSASIAGNAVKKTTVPTLLAADTYNVYATLNYEVTGMTAGTTTEDQFKDMTCNFVPTSFNVGTSGVPMSSRSSAGVMCETVTLTSDNTKDNPLEFALDMERMIAKIQAKKLASYTIYEDRAASGTAVATAVLTGYKAVNLTKKANVFRHVSTPGFGELTGVATGVTNYVVEPTTASKVVPVATMDYANVVGDSDAYTNWNSTDLTHVIYCAENPIPTAAAPHTDYATALAFTATLTPAEGKYYATAGDGGAGPYTAGADLWYYNDCFYASLAVLNEVNALSLTNSDYGKFGVKKFVGGVCYYTYYISHISNGDPEEMSLMEYAIVRNNDYQVTVTKVVAVGNDVQAVKSQPIEMVETFFQATLTVHPWVVRAQDAVLG